MKRTPPPRLGFLGALLGAFIAAAEGLSLLDCASASSVIIAIAGAFGSGAGLAVAITALRTAKQPVPSGVAEGESTDTN